MPVLMPIMLVSLLTGTPGGTLSDPDASPEVIAHRGLLRHAPENTSANFEACLLLQTGFEIDVRRSRDGVLVCVHDQTVDRTTDGQGVVETLSLAELKRLDAGSWFGPSYRGSTIPTYDEVLTLLAAHPGSRVLVAVDMKGDDSRIEADCVALAVERGVLDRLVFIGRAIEHPEVRRRLRVADPGSHVATLAQTAEDLDAAIDAPDADWTYLRFVPTAEQIVRVHRAGKRAIIVGPTVAGREPTNWQRALDAGIDAILTDYPLELNALIRNR